MGLAAACAATQANAALVAYYTLDDSTTNAADSAGSNTGTFIGAPTAVSGLFGNAYSFDGNDGINLGGGSAVRPTGNFTTTFWVSQSTAADGNQLIIGASSTIANAGAGWVVKPQNGGRVFFNTAATTNVDGTDRLVEGASDINAVATDWFFMAARYTQASGIFSYTILKLGESDTDAAGIGTATLSFDGPDTHVIAYGASPPPALIGSLANGTAGFIGRIDEVRYYDNPLNNTELADLYNAGVAAAVPEPSAAVLVCAFGAASLLRRRR